MTVRRMSAATRAYFHDIRHPNDSRGNFLRWAAQIPFRSYIGARAVERHAQGAVPDAWARDMAGKRVLVVGSGPSLDKVGPEFFAGFDTVFYINFAIRRATGAGAEYFYTTDVGPMQEYIEAFGADVFERLGPDHCICAPIFPDQWLVLTDRGRALFTWVRPDAWAWRWQLVTVGSRRLPLVGRYQPRQPDWSSWRLQRGGRTISIIEHTSALSAVLLAATHGAGEIGLIGCDFSTGRAQLVGNAQESPTAVTFSGAADTFRAMQAALARDNVTVTNHSWQV